EFRLIDLIVVKERAAEREQDFRRGLERTVDRGPVVLEVMELLFDLYRAQGEPAARRASGLGLHHRDRLPQFADVIVAPLLAFETVGLPHRIDRTARLDALLVRLDRTGVALLVSVRLAEEVVR